jgi:NADPH:quinone reductase-like Zn-dependent oxidoreductase
MTRKDCASRLEHLAQLIMAGELTPMVDRAYPLEHVPEVMHYLEAGHARGKVVIALADGG